MFVAVNIGMGVTIIAERWPAPFSAEEEALYTNHFPQASLSPKFSYLSHPILILPMYYHFPFQFQLSRGQFKQLLAMGQRMRVADGVELTHEAQHCGKLFFIEEGQAALLLHSRHAANICSGGFVNDVAFQSGDDDAGAYGTVVACGNLHVIAWDCAELRARLDAKPDLKQATDS